MKKIIIIITVMFSYSLLSAAVEFLGFHAEILEMNVHLSWSTATETENLGFILEKKTDSLASWIPLVNYLQDDALLGQGTVSSQTDYLFVDSSVTEGIYYYRISGVDEASALGLLDSLSIRVSTTSIEKYLPDDFILKCCPNPFNPSTAISYQLSTASNVQVMIYNTNGSLLEKLLDRELSAGSHELIWDASGMPSGIYIVRVLAGDNIQTQKIILLK